MDWTGGYASDVEYTAGFYPEQSPQLLNFVCAVNGVEPVALEDGFTYFELGFGRGLTVNLLAAANPGGTFYAADFNPAHVAGARALAGSAGLENVHLLESSFAELAQGAAPDLPQFDFITLHGIYTWVTAENRQHIVDFIGRYLKPGGIVYISYNALPGWAAVGPMQRLLVEYGDAFPNRSDLQIGGAVDFMQEMTDLGALYFHAHPSNQGRFDGLKKHNRNYLVHEYMHKHWQPLYHADVARDLAGVKLQFAGAAELSFAYPQLYLSEERKALIAKMPDPVMRETLKDYFLNVSFRKDVFVRGARKMSTLRRTDWMSHIAVVLRVPRDQITLSMQLAVGTVNGAARIYEPICDALAIRPHTLAELMALPAMQGGLFEDVVQTAALLCASGQAALYPAGNVATPPATAHAMNRAIAFKIRHGNDYQALCSPLLGNGVPTGFVELMVYDWLAHHKGEIDIDVMARDGWALMQSLGRRMVKDGVQMEAEAENIAELRSGIEVIVRDTLPRWRQLNMI